MTVYQFLHLVMLMCADTGSVKASCIDSMNKCAEKHFMFNTSYSNGVRKCFLIENQIGFEPLKK